MKNFLIGFLIVIYVAFVSVIFFEQDNIVNHFNSDNKAKLLAFKVKNNEKLQEANEKVEQRDYKMSTIDNATITHYIDAHNNNYVVTGTMGNKNVKYEFGNEPLYNDKHGVDFYEHDGKIYTTRKSLISDLKGDNEMDAEDRYSEYYGSDGLDIYSTYDKETYTDRKDAITSNVDMGALVAEVIVGVILGMIVFLILMYL